MERIPTARIGPRPWCGARAAAGVVVVALAPPDSGVVPWSPARRASSSRSTTRSLARAALIRAVTITVAAGEVAVADNGLPAPRSKPSTTPTIRPPARFTPIYAASDPTAEGMDTIALPATSASSP